MSFMSLVHKGKLHWISSIHMKYMLPEAPEIFPE